MSPNGAPGQQEPLTRQEQKERTRAALREAGRRAFAELGYAETTIADITGRAGVASGTFYVHFEGKEALVDELLAEFNASLASRLAPVLAASDTAPLPRLVTSTAEAFLDHWEAHRDFVETYAQRSSAGVPMEGLRDGVNPPVAGLLRQALEHAAGRLATCAADLDLVTHALLALWLRVGLQYLFHPHVTREAAVDTLVRMTVGAVGAVLAEEAPHV